MQKLLLIEHGVPEKIRAFPFLLGAEIFSAINRASVCVKASCFWYSADRPTTTLMLAFLARWMVLVVVVQGQPQKHDGLRAEP